MGKTGKTGNPIVDALGSFFGSIPDVINSIPSVYEAGKVGIPKKTVASKSTNTPDIDTYVADTFSQLGIDNDSLVKKQAIRDKNLASITAKFDGNKGDVIGKNTINRVKEVHAFQAEKDDALKQGVTDIFSSALFDPEYGNKMSTLKNGVITNPQISADGTGAKINEINTKILENKLTSKPAKGSTNPTAIPNTSMGFTTGDIIGTVGTAVGSISQMMNTIANAKATKPVVNHYAGFNEKALANNQLAKDALGYNQAQAKTELERTLQVGENTARSRTRNGASSMNSLRALDLAVDTNAGEAKAKGTAEINGSFNQQMMSLMGVDTQLLTQKDQMEMQGAEKADDANAANLDAFYSNFAQNIAGATQNIESLGKNINEAKSRNMFLNILPQTNAWGYGMNPDGTMTAPANYNPNNYQSVKKSDKYAPKVAAITEEPAPKSNTYLNEVPDYLDFWNRGY